MTVLSSELLLVKNNHEGPSVYTDRNKIPYEWEGQDNPAGKDYQDVPEDVIREPRFKDAIRKGIFEIVTEDTRGTSQTFKDARSAVFADSEQYMNRTSARDILALPCVGPGSRGDAKCNVDALVTTLKDLPLCPAHKNLAASFTPYEDENGKQSWVRAIITRRNEPPVGE